MAKYINHNCLTYDIKYALRHFIIFDEKKRRLKLTHTRFIQLKFTTYRLNMYCFILFANYVYVTKIIIMWHHSLAFIFSQSLFNHEPYDFTTGRRKCKLKKKKKKTISNVLLSKSRESLVRQGDNSGHFFTLPAFI